MLVALAGLLVALGAPPTAEPRVDLVWTAPASCPDAAAVHARLRALAPDLPAGPVVRAEATVVARPGPVWRMRLALRGQDLDDRRTLEARDCRSLADVTALLLALAVAPEAVAARVAAAGSPPDPPAPGSTPPPGSAEPASTPAHAPAEPPPAPSTIPPAPDAPPRPIPHARPEPPQTSPLVSEWDSAADPLAAHAPSPAPRSLRGAARLSFAGDLGALSRWSPAGALGLALLGPAWRLELQGTYAARRLAYPERPDLGGHLQLAAGSVRGCGVPRWRRLEFPVCGGLELGLVRAVGRGVPEPREVRELWLALQLGPGLAWAPVPRLALTLGLDLLIPLRRPGFHIENLGELARARALGLRPLLGIEVRFP